MLEFEIVLHMVYFNELMCLQVGHVIQLCTFVQYSLWRTNKKIEYIKHFKDKNREKNKEAMECVLRLLNEDTLCAPSKMVKMQWQSWTIR